MATVTRRSDGRWFVRYRDPDSKEHVRTFDRKSDAQRYADRTSGDLVRGEYIDPLAGKVLFGQYAEAWCDAQVHRATTTAQLQSHMKNHILPFFKSRQISSVRPSEIQGWVKGRSES